MRKRRRKSFVHALQHLHDNAPAQPRTYWEEVEFLASADAETLNRSVFTEAERSRAEWIREIGPPLERGLEDQNARLIRERGDG